MTTPHDEFPDVEVSYGMQVNRELTHTFIENDPYTATLIPVSKVKKPGGGIEKVDELPRPEQTFKLIYQGMFESGVAEAQDGTERKYDYIMLGEWNATVHIGDHWMDDAGGSYTVIGITPYNGYETKATVRYFGKEPLLHG